MLLGAIYVNRMLDNYSGMRYDDPFERYERKREKAKKEADAKFLEMNLAEYLNLREIYSREEIIFIRTKELYDEIKQMYQSLYKEEYSIEKDHG